MTLLLLLACNPEKIAAAAAIPLEPDPIVAVFPPDGSRHLLGDVPVAIALGEAGAGVLPSVTASLDGDAPVDLACTLTDDGLWASCDALPDLAGSLDAVDLTVTVGGTTATAHASSSPPEPGLGWDLLDGTSITTFGGSEEAAKLADDELVKGDLLVALDGWDGTPGSWDLVGGPVDAEGEVWVPRAPGFTFVTAATVGADGGLVATADAAWLALQVDGVDVPLLLLDVRLSGTLAGETLPDLVLTAHVPAVALQSLASPLGKLGPELLDLVSLDVDRDGDGTPDAASLRLEGSPTPAVLKSWTGG